NARPTISPRAPRYQPGVRSFGGSGTRVGRATGASWAAVAVTAISRPPDQARPNAGDSRLPERTPGGGRYPSSARYLLACRSSLAHLAALARKLTRAWIWSEVRRCPKFEGMIPEL